MQTVVTKPEIETINKFMPCWRVKRKRFIDCFIMKPIKLFFPWLPWILITYELAEQRELYVTHVDPDSSISKYSRQRWEKASLTETSHCRIFYKLHERHISLPTEKTWQKRKNYFHSCIKGFLFPRLADSNSIRALQCIVQAPAINFFTFFKMSFEILFSISFFRSIQYPCLQEV